MKTLIEIVAEAIEHQIDVVEMVDASPSIIRKLRAARIARIAVEAIRNAEPTDAGCEQHDCDAEG